jgi:hypothetical protein
MLTKLQDGGSRNASITLLLVGRRPPILRKSNKHHLHRHRQQHGLHRHLRQLLRERSLRLLHHLQSDPRAASLVLIHRQGTVVMPTATVAQRRHLAKMVLPQAV